MFTHSSHYGFTIEVLGGWAKLWIEGLHVMHLRVHLGFTPFVGMGPASFGVNPVAFMHHLLARNSFP